MFTLSFLLPEIQLGPISTNFPCQPVALTPKRRQVSNGVLNGVRKRKPFDNLLWDTPECATPNFAYLVELITCQYFEKAYILRRLYCNSENSITCITSCLWVSQITFFPRQHKPHQWRCCPTNRWTVKFRCDAFLIPLQDWRADIGRLEYDLSVHRSI